MRVHLASGAVGPQPTCRHGRHFWRQRPRRRACRSGSGSSLRRRQPSARRQSSLGSRWEGWKDAYKLRQQYGIWCLHLSWAIVCRGGRARGRGTKVRSPTTLLVYGPAGGSSAVGATSAPGRDWGHAGAVLVEWCWNLKVKSTDVPLVGGHFGFYFACGRMCLHRTPKPIPHALPSVPSRPGTQTMAAALLEREGAVEELERQLEEATGPAWWGQKQLGSALPYRAGAKEHCCDSCPVLLPVPGYPGMMPACAALPPHSTMGRPSPPLRSLSGAGQVEQVGRERDVAALDRDTFQEQVTALRADKVRCLGLVRQEPATLTAGTSRLTSPHAGSALGGLLTIVAGEGALTETPLHWSAAGGLGGAAGGRADRPCHSAGGAGICSCIASVHAGPAAGRAGRSGAGGSPLCLLVCLLSCKGTTHKPAQLRGRPLFD